MSVGPCCVAVLHSTPYRSRLYFDASIRVGDHNVLGYDRFQETTFHIVTNIRHPEEVKKTWWAMLEPFGPPDVTVAGQTYSSRR
jgi:hypothetical protein